jgi:hypothetical protein
VNDLYVNDDDRVPMPQAQLARNCVRGVRYSMHVHPTSSVHYFQNPDGNSLFVQARHWSGPIALIIVNTTYHVH